MSARTELYDLMSNLKNIIFSHVFSESVITDTSKYTYIIKIILLLTEGANLIHLYRFISNLF